MASQTATTRTSTAKKEPQDHKAKSADLRAEAVKDNDNISLLTPPGALSRGKRQRLTGLLVKASGDADEDDVAERIADSSPDLMEDIADFIEANCVPVENRETVEALNEIEFMEMAFAYLSLAGELLASKN